MARRPWGGGEPQRSRCVRAATASIVPAMLSTGLLLAGCASAPPPSELDAARGLAAFARGQRARLDGDLARAETELALAVAEDPLAARPRAELGALLSARKEVDRARVELELARALDPEHVLGVIELADLEVRALRLKSARDLLLELLERHPRNAPALALVHPLLLYGGDVDTGRELYARARDLRPDLACVHEAYGDFLSQGGDRVGAIVSYRRALLLRPRDTGVRNKLVRLLEPRQATSDARSAPETAGARVGVPAAPDAAR